MTSTVGLNLASYNEPVLRPADDPAITDPIHRAPDFKLDDLSPVQKHRALVERIRQVFEETGFQLPDLNIPIEAFVSPFSTDEDEISLTSIGYSAPLVGGILGNAGSRLLTSTSSVPRSRSLIQPSGGPSPLTAFFAGAAILSTGVFFVATSYSRYADEIRRDILSAYGQIADDGINQQEFRNFVETVYQRKLESYFNRVFEICNPTSIGYLLLSMGIAEDSFGNHLQAQIYYQTSLNYNIQPHLRDCIYYVYARSLRLSNAPHQVIREQIEKIRQSSSLYQLGQIERQALELGNNEVFDAHIPACFICPINQDLMTQPVYYQDGDHRYYFEYEAIRAWLRERPTNPLTQQPLNEQQLVIDRDLAGLIVIWNQTKLKHQ